MRDLGELRRFYSSYAEKDSLILCTIVNKNGSSYRSVGAKKIVARNGSSIGLLSGGCLEAAIEKTARERFDELPLVETFSTEQKIDRLFGYQSGCQGVIQVLFEKMRHRDLNLLLPYGSPQLADGVRVQLTGEMPGDRKFSQVFPSGPDAMFEPWCLPIHLALIGCGSDAAAYVPFAKGLNWTLQMLDWREFGPHKADDSETVIGRHPVDEIAAHVPEGRNVAAVLMTHNYGTDLEILRSLRQRQIGYLGCLGPAVRYRQLKEDLFKLYQESISAEFDSIVCAPAGIFSRSNSANEIALSVVAQIQARLVEIETLKKWTLILAAGESKRFGEPKALAVFSGQTLLSRAIATGRLFSGDNVMVVTGCYGEKLQAQIEGVEIAVNHDWKEGMGTSIAAGVAAVLACDPRAELIVILPVDQPMVNLTHLKKLANESVVSRRCALTADTSGVSGAPAAVPKEYFTTALQLKGARGMKSVLGVDDTILVENSLALCDIDEQKDLLALQANC